MSYLNEGLALMEEINYILTDENVAEFSTFLSINKRKTIQKVLLTKFLLLAVISILQFFVFKKAYSFAFILFLGYVIFTKYDPIIIRTIYRKILKNLQKQDIVYNNIKMIYNDKMLKMIENRQITVLNKNDILSLIYLEKVCVVNYNGGSIIMPLDKIKNKNVLNKLCYKTESK